MALEKPTMELWLVRTTKNWIAGPYTKEQACQIILEGKLTHQDEVCRANGYWMYLHEFEEIRKALGIEVPRAKDADEEVTDTKMVPEDMGIEPTKKLTVEETAAEHDSQAEGITTMYSAEKLQELRTKGKRPTSKDISTEITEPVPATKLPDRRVETPSPRKYSYQSKKSKPKELLERALVWRGLIWVLLAVLGAIVIYVSRLLRP